MPANEADLFSNAALKKQRGGQTPPPPSASEQAASDWHPAWRCQSMQSPCPTTLLKS